MKTPEQAWNKIAEVFRSRHSNATWAKMGKKQLHIEPLSCANKYIFGADHIIVFPIRMAPTKGKQGYNYSAGMLLQRQPTDGRSPDELVKFVQVNNKPDAPTITDWAEQYLQTFCRHVCTEPSCPFVTEK